MLGGAALTGGIEGNPTRAGYYARVGRQIAGMRIARGWDQRELARRCGVPRGWIARVEQGRQQVYMHQLRMLGLVFAVRFGALVEQLNGAK